MKSFNVRNVADEVGGRLRFVPALLLALSTLLLATAASAAELVINGGFEEPSLASLPATSRGATLGWTTFYGQNKSDLDPCSGHQDPFDSSNDWEVECNGDMKIPGWSVYWTDTVLAGVPEPGRIELQSNSLPTRVNPIFVQMNIDNGWGPLDPQFKSPISMAKFGEQKAEMDSHDRINILTGKPITDSNVTLAQTLDTCPDQNYLLTYYWRSRTTDVGDNDVRVLVGNTIVRTHTLTGDWVKESVHFVADNTGKTDIAFMSVGTASTLGMSLDGVSVVGPAPDLLGNCPPPPSCKKTPTSCTPDGFADINNDGVHDDLDHHVDGQPIGCACVDDGTSSDGTSGDGTSGDGTSGDGTSGDGTSSDDNSSDDGACGLCAGKGHFGTLTLLYDGDDFTSHNQDPDKASVVPDPVPGGLPVEAHIVVTGKQGAILFTGLVAKGQLFDVVKPDNNVHIEIFDGDTLVQTIEFHASCSQPLDKNDTFGGITIWDGSKEDKKDD